MTNNMQQQYWAYALNQNEVFIMVSYELRHPILIFAINYTADGFKTQEKY